MAFSGADLAALAVAAVLTAGLYTTMSFGLALVYGVMRIINLAHAGTMMLGAFVVLSLHRAFGLDPIAGSFVAFPLFFVAGMLLYRFVVQRVAQGPPIASLLLLFAVWLCLQNAAYLIWGSEDQSIVTAYTFLSVSVGGVRIAVTRVVPFVVSLVTLVLLTWFLRATRMGKAIRAVSQNATSARLVGIRADQVNRITFGLGTALSAFAGGLLTLLFSFNPDFGGVFQLKSFAIIVLGGLESLPGVALGACVLAGIESFSILIPGWRASLINLLAFGILVVSLIVLPGGLTGLFERGGRHR
ncbi:MAG TPA: branched-chain amino acid ABC transporter permease [Candidatus Methylomirabilis sp.]|nr:branched-chain amino acid ABC transporter permease [Candidatus Methylomirabilis sp.]